MSVAVLETSDRLGGATAPDVSRWTMRGDVGIFSRVVDLDVRVAERAAPERVRFTVGALAARIETGGRAGR
jgi:hypothetical protein